jgi:hypothetical protein
MTPRCPGCHDVVTVTRATFLMPDHSRPGSVQMQKQPAAK